MYDDGVTQCVGFLIAMLNRICVSNIVSCSISKSAHCLKLVPFRHSICSLMYYIYFTLYENSKQIKTAVVTSYSILN